MCRARRSMHPCWSMAPLPFADQPCWAEGRALIEGIGGNSACEAAWMKAVERRDICRLGSTSSSLRHNALVNTQRRPGGVVLGGRLGSEELRRLSPDGL